jgi:AcrR family transcriptional regulator
MATKKDPERTPSGRRKVPLGIREGGAEWERIHGVLAAAALEMLAERGYADMVMTDVAELAGMSKRTVYRHYPTKVDLAVAAIRELPPIGPWSEGAGTVRDRLGRATAIALDKEQRFAGVLATALVHRDSVPVLLETLRSEVMRPRLDAVRVFVERGQAEGEIRAGVEPEAVWALIMGLMIQHLDGQRPTRGKRGAAMDFDAMWSMIGA